MKLTDRLALGIILLSGLTGSSKSTILQLIFEFLVDLPMHGRERQFIWIDTSKCLDISKARQTPAGIELAKLDGDKKDGLVLAANPVTESIEENLGWLREEFPFMTTLGVAGSTRSIEETEYWQQKSNVRQGIVHATHAQVKSSIDGRIARAIKKGGQVRDDDLGARTLKNKLDQFDEKIMPGINAWQKHLVHELHRSMPLTDRVQVVVQNMYSDNPLETVIGKDVLDDWLSKLDDQTHPIHFAIKEVENGHEIPDYKELVLGYMQKNRRHPRPVHRMEVVLA